METIKKHINKIVAIIVLIFIGTFIYNMVNKEDDKDVIEKKVVEDNDNIEVIQILDQLKKISIDETFFEEDLGYEGSNLISFKDLEDFSVDVLEDKPVGKENPFLDSNILENITNEGGNLGDTDNIAENN